MTNGEKITQAFPNAEVRFVHNMSDMHFVEVNFNDTEYEGWGTSTVHSFSRKWWDSESIEELNNS